MGVVQCLDSIFPLFAKQLIILINSKNFAAGQLKVEGLLVKYKGEGARARGATRGGESSK